ncbi:Uncharacterized HTH-type transcriptional regulator ytcD [Proteus mirabilis]|uniref:Uncharacterized HTH-type transcriptional regulator ytcD n=1 Tax=Proteus mirabilis TaxID=584 RepID=A0A2X2BIA4_PROMI|nr:Uncharacterized HTH-type transcriptional regulator ytcD [Proteus mirabilis]
MTISTLSQQLREGNLFSKQCPSREILKHVTSRWGILILIALRDGTHRFSDLRRKIGGVSEKMLSQSLQVLEQDGFINRVSYPVVPPHVEYSLTDLGEQISGETHASCGLDRNKIYLISCHDQKWSSIQILFLIIMYLYFS